MVSFVCFLFVSLFFHGYNFFSFLFACMIVYCGFFCLFVCLLFHGMFARMECCPSWFKIEQRRGGKPDVPSPDAILASMRSTYTQVRNRLTEAANVNGWYVPYRGRGGTWYRCSTGSDGKTRSRAGSAWLSYRPPAATRLGSARLSG